MVDLAPWPDAHEILRLCLDDLGPVRIVGPRTPLNFLGGGLPVYAVRRIGGANADKISDSARVNIDVFAATYEDSRDHAEAIRQRLLSRPQFTAEGRIDKAEVEIAPIEIPYPAEDVFVHSAVYRLSLRR